MIIRRAVAEDIPQLYEFNHRMYPERTNYKEIVDFWISKGPNEVNNIVVTVDDDGIIRGQQFFSSMAYFRNGIEVESTWAFDLIVDEELRSGSHGFSLMWRCKKEHPNSMSSGSNDISLPINLKIGNKHIGDLKKFVGISNPIWLCTSVFRGNVESSSFPMEIAANGNTFKKIPDTTGIPVYSKSFNPHLIDFSRNKEFLSWRFFNDLHDYVLYKSETTDDYFVVRTIVKHHITALVLVDYRCRLTSDISFRAIMESFIRLASKLKIFMLIVGSSLSVIDNVCLDYHMKSVGRDRPILGMIDCDNPDEQRLKRNFVCLTLADSDGDITW